VSSSPSNSRHGDTASIYTHANSEYNLLEAKFINDGRILSIVAFWRFLATGALAVRRPATLNRVTDRENRLLDVNMAVKWNAGA
jgi:hypothetical protein